MNLTPANQDNEMGESSGSDNESVDAVLFFGKSFVTFGFSGEA